MSDTFKVGQAPWETKGIQQQGSQGAMNNQKTVASAIPSAKGTPSVGSNPPGSSKWGKDTASVPVQDNTDKKDVYVPKKGLFGSEKTFGEVAAAALQPAYNKLMGDKTPLEQYKDALTMRTDLISSHVKTMKEAMSVGIDVSNMKKVIQDEINTPAPSFSDFAGSAINATPEQVAGAGAGVFTDLLTATAQLPAAAAGAAFGLTHALQENKGVVGTTVDTALGAIGGKILQYGFETFAPFISKAIGTYGAPLVEKLSQYIPDSAKSAFQELASKVSSAGESLAKKATIGDGTGGTDAVKKAGNLIDNPIDYAVGKAKQAGSAAVDSVKGTLSPKSEAQVLSTPPNEVYKLSQPERTLYFQRAKEAVTAENPVSTLTKEQILSTPAENLHTLSPSERKFYFDQQKATLSRATDAEKEKISQEFDKQQETIKSENEKKQAEIDKKASDAEKLAKEKMDASAKKSQSEADDLNRKLKTSSRDKVIELRPKIKTALATQSQTYRDLVQQDLAPFKDTKVSQNDISEFIDQRFGADPEKAAEIKGRLGIQTRDPSLPPMTPEAQKYADAIGMGERTDTTLGDMYQKTLSLRQDIGQAGVKGTRAYTPDEKLTDDSISVLSDYMKKEGVDLSSARSFWAKYAPVRDQLISEAKPFNIAGTQTKKFATTLMNVASGNDVNNENFIGEVEKLLGEPVTDEQKTLLSKLDQSQKNALAEKEASQTKIDEAKAEKDQKTAEAKAEKDQKTAEAKAEKDQKTAEAELKKQKSQGLIDDEKFNVEKKALDEKYSQEYKKASDISKIEQQQFEVEQKARSRARMKKILGGLATAVGGGATVEFFKKVF